MNAMPIVYTVVAAPVLVRVCLILYQLSKAHFQTGWRRNGFALGYALLGALTGQLLVDAWSGQPVDVHEIGFVLASSLLIIFDRRRHQCLVVENCPAERGQQP